MSWVFSILIAIGILLLIGAILWFMFWIEWEFDIPAIALMVILGALFIFVWAIHELIF